MHAHTVETSQARTDRRPDDPLVPGTTVTAVGTFAAGQSDRGSIHVAVDVETGSFASGLSESAPSATA